MSECTLALLAGTFHGIVDAAVQHRGGACRPGGLARCTPLQMSGHLAEGVAKARQGQGEQRRPDGDDGQHLRPHHIQAGTAIENGLAGMAGIIISNIGITAGTMAGRFFTSGLSR